MASSWSSGGPQMPSPVMRMAPKPMRRTVMSPRLNVPDGCPVVVISQPKASPDAADSKHCGGDDEVRVVLDRALDADEQDAQREDPPRRRRDHPLADQAD